MTACNLAAQTIVSGTVTDGKEALAGANVFIIGTIDGCLTDSLGRFSFTTSTTGEVTLSASFIGFEDYKLTTDAARLTNLHIQMKERATSIDEVVVTASTFSFGKSDNFKTMDALDVVMAGNSCGDIVAALQTLPGTQMVGENGKLYVRGGESDECQTFVNGMHVLVPYSTNTENSAVRGRFSPFLFKGINFSLGGYGGEYGHEDHSRLKNLSTTLSYSFNDSRRLYLDYTEEQMPDYCSRHNLRLTAKYAIGKTIIGLSESYASGRHFPNGTTPHYNSVDMNLTWLVSPKVIVYTSLNNVFGRTNIFRFDANGTPVTASRDRFLYIGIFVSLKNNKAYDISNF